MAYKKGKQSYQMVTPPFVLARGGVVGPVEGIGPLGPKFDRICEDEYYGESTWEKAESKFLKDVIELLISKSGKPSNSLDLVLSGDLLNQCTASTFGLRDSQIPLIGLFGACSTMAQSSMLASLLIDGGGIENACALTSSHFCSAEKQFRNPLELGVQKPPAGQRTVTGSGGLYLTSGKDNTGPGIIITSVTVGKIIDFGIKDVNNMGAAMAPAAADTIYSHYSDMGIDENFYDLVITGDLAELGTKHCIELLDMQNLHLKDRFSDCGLLVYDRETQDVNCGGSGCGCSAVVMACHILDELEKDKWQRILFIGTGALMSPTTSQQGESIPGIAHAVAFEKRREPLL